MAPISVRIGGGIQQESVGFPLARSFTKMPSEASSSCDGFARKRGPMKKRPTFPLASIVTAKPAYFFGGAMASFIAFAR